MFLNVHLNSALTVIVTGDFTRHAVHESFDRRTIVGKCRHGLPDQAAGGGQILAGDDRLQRVGQLIRGADFSDLADLLDQFAVVQRIQWILVLQLGNHQLQKRVHTDVARSLLAGWAGSGREMGPTAGTRDMEFLSFNWGARSESVL